MRKTNLIIFFIAVIVFAGTFLISLVSFPHYGGPSVNKSRPQTDGISDVHSSFKIPKTGMHTFMGKSQVQILKMFGKPERVDATKYGYHWFIYGRNSEKYIQIGLDDHSEKVVTIYVLGNKLKTMPFKIGSQSQQIYEQIPVSDELSIHEGKLSFDVELNEEDMMARPLIKFGNNVVQLNFDHVSDRLIGVRYLSPRILAMQRSYAMTYKGALPELPSLTAKEHQSVDDAEDREIFDLTNMLRMRFGKRPLKGSAPVARAAYLHSREMKTKDYFSHDSKWSGDLRARLNKEDVSFRTAGENIAARYPDAAAVTLGWLNSLEHRKNMLSGDFTELGVGTYRNYYTQDFIRPADF